MNWQRVIETIDVMSELAMPEPPYELRERAKKYAHKLMESGVSAPKFVTVTSEDIEFRWTFPRHDMLCVLWEEGCGVWRLLFEHGRAEITSWPLEE